MMVVGSSMDPALLPGQLVLLHRDYYRTHPLERGDVVVFRWKGCVYVKRVYALAGGQVKLVRNDDCSFLLVSGTEGRMRRLARRHPYLGLRTVVVPPGC